ncbi:MAG TPA: hypothetical protein VJV39_02905 [Dongiaceae bacterium]|nr:hypothetical protein [Dongiaceae bacterium]
MRGEPMVLGAISKLYAAALAREIHDFSNGCVSFVSSARDVSGLDLA